LRLFISEASFIDKDTIATIQMFHLQRCLKVGPGAGLAVILLSTKTMFVKLLHQQ